MESSASPADTPLGQVRILLQTRTHLPVGQGRGEKLEFMKDIVCQHLWKRDFDKGQERWYPYNDLFGLEDRLCFFLIDHFGHNHAQEREGPVPVLRFEWDGEALNQIHEDLPSKLKTELEKWPFTWEGRKWHRVPKEPDGTYSPVNFRLIMRSQLRLGVPLLQDHIEFVGKYPEHALWLREHLEEHLWAVLEPYSNLPPRVRHERAI
ncbi:hypothetical protein NLU13_6862 [Sarocladium strictum]|uniref:Uncharacterized protein n=1 Tax=Sarocladium strictum TaxID=5046 RepID=A0AA39L6E9_SARSR|nr:hypothetical protein NLU13_6862 [Sarocladium strictum]